MAKPPKIASNTKLHEPPAPPITPPLPPLGNLPGEIAMTARGTAHGSTEAGPSSQPFTLPAQESHPTVTIHHRPATSDTRPSVIAPRLPTAADSLPAAVTPASHIANWIARHFATGHEPAFAVPSVNAQMQQSYLIDAELAAQLKKTPSTEEGFWYDKFKKAYVEIPDGMVMVKKQLGGWRQTRAGEATPTGKWVVKNPDSKIWREMDSDDIAAPASPQASATTAADAGPGPAKRPRLTEDNATSSGSSVVIDHIIFGQQSAPLDLSSAHWKNWGKTTKPVTGESVEIAGMHYPIVEQVLASDTDYVYLQHPTFKPEGFDAFEDMLRHDPSKQPKWVTKINGQWEVAANVMPFEMSPTQYVSRSVRHLSERSANSLAKAVSDRVTTPQGIGADGLTIMSLTFRHWLNRTQKTPYRDLSDPLLILPTLTTRPHDQYEGGMLHLPAPDSTPLQRLDFDIPDTTPANSGIRELFEQVLQDNGYTINPRQHPLANGEDVFIFHREGLSAVFVLKLPALTQTAVPRYTVAGSEMANPQFKSTLSPAEKQALDEQLTRYDIIYLVGGKQQISPGSTTLFIVREG
ncbi:MULTISPECIES: hypothetical protein [unclassified Pseudomonas]|uniref:hypothetical protein n=1 Tax=unclassified Pseudomonas TaxID=196821 RepID=UPI0028934BCB|nr:MULTISPECIES: hypothetical protein [unclassified Pseudomonas]